MALRVVELLAIGQRADHEVFDAIDGDARLVGAVALHASERREGLTLVAQYAPKDSSFAGASK
jgi:hypothetical protein